ncbi:hypothetical protein JYQ62_15365 [Nostoc sp. UHCC 0702]|nr:hypothetical protein JYQ62_15365 [Nostoc sp. UHCC 0702]
MPECISSWDVRRNGMRPLEQGRWGVGEQGGRGDGEQGGRGEITNAPCPFL